MKWVFGSYKSFGNSCSLAIYVCKVRKLGYRGCVEGGRCSSVVDCGGSKSVMMEGKEKEKEYCGGLNTPGI